MQFGLPSFHYQKHLPVHLQYWPYQYTYWPHAMQTLVVTGKTMDDLVAPELQMWHRPPRSLTK